MFVIQNIKCYTKHGDRMTLIKELMDKVNERMRNDDLMSTMNVLPCFKWFKRNIQELAKKDLEILPHILDYTIWVQDDYKKDLEDVIKDV